MSYLVIWILIAAGLFVIGLISTGISVHFDFFPLCVQFMLVWIIFGGMYGCQKTKNIAVEYNKPDLVLLGNNGVICVDSNDVSYTSSDYGMCIKTNKLYIKTTYKIDLFNNKYDVKTLELNEVENEVH